MVCSEAAATVSRVFSLVFWIIGAASHVAVLALITRIFKQYHLFFIIFYTLLIAAHFMSASVKTTGYFLVLTAGRDVPEQVNDALWISKMFTQAAAMACVLERGYATLYATVYENSRRCSFIAICFVACTLNAALTYAESSNDIGRKVNAVSYGAFLTITTVSLIFINRKLVIKSTMKSSLSERYQLRENVKALRLLLPFVVTISVNAVVFSVGVVLFDVDPVFDLNKCHTVPTYLPIFYVFLCQTTFFNSGASFLVLYRNGLRGRKIGAQELRNEQIVADGRQNEHYFQQYKTQWA